MVQGIKKDFRGLLPHPMKHCIDCSAVGRGLPDQQANYFCSTILSPDTQLLPSYWSYGALWERKRGDGDISTANALKLFNFVPPAIETHTQKNTLL